MAKKRKKNIAPASATQPSLNSPLHPSTAKQVLEPPPDQPASPTCPAPQQPSNNPNIFLKIAPWLGLALTIALSIAWVLTHAYMVYNVTVRICEEADSKIPKEERVPIFLSEIAFDGYLWNRHAEHLGKNGSLRLRFTDFDNAPHGREVHWNSAFAWYLRGLGEIYRAINGDTLRNSIYRMSIWANPILLVIALLILPVLAARRFGPISGAVIAVGMVAVPTFYEGFLPAYPDHHGIINFALLGTVFGIAWAAAGWIRQSDDSDFLAAPDIRTARQGLWLSAICGACGLWFSALSTGIFLGSIGISVLITSALFARSKNTQALLDPDLWKFWAIRGSAIALILYAIEYFPNHMSMRMEINHPLYALSWLSGGWILAILTRWLRAPEISNFPWRKLLLPAAACSILPLVILLGGDSVYSPRDPFMGRLWKNIAELLPLLLRIQIGGLSWQIAIGWFPILLLMAIALVLFLKIGRGSKATLLFLCVPIIIITGLQFYQTRWGLLVGPIYIALAAVLFPQIWKITPHNPLERIISAGIMLGFATLLIQPAFRGIFSVAWTQFSARDGIPITPGQALALLHRQMAYTIKKDAQGKPVVLLSSPNSSCLLASFGDFKTIGTLYWENVDGLKTAAKALNAQSDEKALDIFKDLGITHISLMSWENFIEPYFRILYPERVPGITFESSFGKRALFDRRIPHWCRPLIFPPNELTKSLQQTVIMLAVEPNQSIQDAKLNVAKFAWRVQDDPIAAELSLKEILDSNPSHLLAGLELVDLFLSQKRYTQASEQLLRTLSLSPLEGRQNLAEPYIAQFQSAGREDLASQIAQILTSLPAQNP